MANKYKTNPNYYCEICGSWMADHPQVRANHDRGLKHKANLERKLSDMRRRGDQEKKQQAYTESSMTRIEAAAAKQYAADKAAATEAMRTQLGAWEFHVKSGYYYNAVQRWYYDLKSKMYYGGDPAAWTASPPIPKEAMYGAEDAAAAAAAPSGEAARTTTAAPARPQAVVAGMRKSVAAHPQAGVGGYSMPEIGRIGGAKGVGAMATSGGAAGSKGGEKTAVKRKADEKPLTKEEAEFLARREAARQRVQSRTMAGFGLG